jgi:hypothetical protein
MSTSISIHNVTNVTTSGVSYYNSNGITLAFETAGHWGTLPHKVTIFGLPAHIAEALENLLGDGGVKPALNEADIRADERRKINARIRESIDPVF